MIFLKADSPGKARARRVFIRKCTSIGIAIAVAVVVGFTGWAWRTDRLTSYADMAKEKVVAVTSALGMNLKNIYLEGHRHVKPEALKEVLSLHYGQPLLTISLDEMKREVESLGWVKEAEIQRQFPSTLHIHVAERDPFAIWQHQGILHLIDRQGNVISQGEIGDYWHLPILVGAEANMAAEEIFTMLHSEKTLKEMVSSIIRVGARRWNVRLNNGIEIKLPETDPQAAWHFLAGMHRDKRLLDRDIRTVDLRMPDRLYIQVRHAASQDDS